MGLLADKLFGRSKVGQGCVISPDEEMSAQKVLAVLFVSEDHGRQYFSSDAVYPLAGIEYSTKYTITHNIPSYSCCSTAPTAKLLMSTSRQIVRCPET